MTPRAEQRALLDGFETGWCISTSLLDMRMPCSAIMLTKNRQLAEKYKCNIEMMMALNLHFVSVAVKLFFIRHVIIV